jgi:hypothetical protein
VVLECRKQQFFILIEEVQKEVYMGSDSTPIGEKSIEKKDVTQVYSCPFETYLAEERKMHASF